MDDRRTLVCKIDPACPDTGAIEKAAAVLRDGGLVAFPTETVYGLGANALDPQAVRRIYEVKGRPSQNPIIVHVADTTEARRLVTCWPESAMRLASRFWPGPLTLVLPRSLLVPDIIAAAGPTVAVRCPAHPVALALIRAARVPLAAPSANRSSELSPTRPEHVLRSLGGLFDLILDGGPTAAGIESTVIDLSGESPRLLRPGPISPKELESLLGPVERGNPQTRNSDAALPSPGLLSRHYSPRTPVECYAATEDLIRRQREITTTSGRAGIVLPDNFAETGWPDTVEFLPSDPVGYAAGLYRVLHELDRRGLDRILVLLPPDADEWLAVRDRLLHASASAG